jgi:hypothetical protein
MFMNTRLIFKFSQEQCNGAMNLHIKQGDQVLWTKNTTDPRFECTLNVEWPVQLELVLSGKGANDTVLAEDGTIKQDKYIKLESMIVDRMPVHILSLLELLELDTGKEKIKTNYWGFNGVVTLNFTEPDSTIWHIKSLTHVNKQKTTVITEHHDNAGQGTIY